MLVRLARLGCLFGADLIDDLALGDDVLGGDTRFVQWTQLGEEDVVIDIQTDWGVR
jgi:hypothetical protein